MQRLARILIGTLLRLIPAILILSFAQPAAADPMKTARWGASLIQVNDLPGASVTIDYLRDPDALLGFREVSQDPVRNGFKPIVSGFSAGLSHGADWYRIRIVAPPTLIGQVAFVQVRPTHLDDIRFYRRDGIEQRSGVGWPVSQRNLPDITPTVAMPLERAENVLYVRLQSVGSVAVYFELFSETSLRERLHQRGLKDGLLLGAILIVLFVNLINWGWTRDPLYRDYLFFLGSLAVLNASDRGYMHFYVFPEQPHWGGVLDAVALSWMVAGAILFATRLLGISSLLPATTLWIRRGAIAFAFFGMLAAPLSVGNLVSEAALVLLSVLGVASLLLAALRLWRTPTLGTGVIFLAFLVFMGFQSISAAGYFGLLPATERILVAWQVGTLLHLFLFHFALVARLRERNQAELAARVETFKARAEADEEKRRVTEMHRFLGMLAHEVSTPLAVIDSSLESLELLQATPNARQTERFGRIRRASRQLNRLMNESLSRDRLMSAGWKLKLQPMRPVELLRSATDSLDLPAPAGWPSHRPLEMPLEMRDGTLGLLRVQPMLQSIEFVADPHLLAVAVNNLLDNACKYGKPGSVVKLSIQPAGIGINPALHIAVESETIPIAAEDLDRLFDKYFRRDDYLDVPGAGLGLHLVRHIMTLHGGEATVRMEDDLRICFTLALPPRGTGR